MMGVLSDQSGIEAREVTVQDAVRGVFGLQDDYTKHPPPASTDSERVSLLRN